MSTYDKEQFKEYLSTKVAESTAKTYATDMAVCVKALEKIKLYEGKELAEILEDFVSHKKDVKNYLQDEFLKGLSDIGSNDSGLYDSLLSKAKHYIKMLENPSSEKNKVNSQLNDMRCTMKIKLTGEEWNMIGSDITNEFEDNDTIYTINLTNCENLTNWEILEKTVNDSQLLQEIYEEWAEGSYSEYYIHYIEFNGITYDESSDFSDDVYEAKIIMDVDNKSCYSLV